MNSHFRTWILTALLAAFAAAPTCSQTADSLATFRMRLTEARGERERLQRMLGALNVVDSVYKRYYPAWNILDEDLRHRIFRALRLRFQEEIADTDIVVVAHPDLKSVVEVSAGSHLLGRRDLQVAFGETLLHDIIAREYPYRSVDAMSELFAEEKTSFGPPRCFAAMSASLFQTTLLFKNGMGVEAALGREEIGYPFWSTGEVRFSGIYKGFRLGIIAPIISGRPADGRFPSPLDIRPRLLTGTKGISMDLTIPTQGGIVGGLVSVGEVTRAGNTALFVFPLENYYIHSVIQGWYSGDFSWGERSKQSLRVTAGAGFHQIALGRTEPDLRVVAVSKEDFISPLIRLNYVNQGQNSFGVNCQYYSSVFLLQTWIEFVKNILFLDLKYSTQLLRQAKPWEQPYFFMISPRIQLSY